MSDYEKKYKEALEVAKRKLCFDKAGMVDSFTPNDIYEMFPELKESDDDRIRKKLIGFLRNIPNSNYTCEEMALWLEEQGEQKPVDKAEPKFNVGDWIIDVQGVSANQIIGYEDDSYYIETSCSKFYLPMKLAEKNYRLWTIQDAKDGDALATGQGNIFIFKSISNCVVCDYCGLYYGKFMDCSANVNSPKSAPIGFHPATKEQRDLLFQKMKEEGYVWDSEKKQLRKNEEKVDSANKVEPKDYRSIDPHFFKSADKIEKQPSQWNISDYRTWQYIVSDVLTKHDGIGQYLDNGEYKKIAKYMQEEWSKKLSLELNTAWSEEDNVMIRCITLDLELLKNRDDGKAGKAAYQSEIEWIKSLKDRVQPQPKQKWSEWDRSKIQRICKYLEEAKKYYADITEVRECIEWLKSLVPQNKWKPSDAQMIALNDVITNGKLSNANERILKGLQEQLKKLK